MKTTNNNNLANFRLKPAAMWVLENQLKDDESISHFCQRIVYAHLGVTDDNSDLKTREFEALIANIIDDSVSPMINYLQDRVNALDEELKILKTNVSLNKTQEKPKNV